MVMPRTEPDRLLSHQSTESIPEEETEPPSEVSELAAPNLNNEDGTFLIPKLNKVEVGPRQEFKSKTITVDLKHHLFESNPLETSPEPSSGVILGQPISTTLSSSNENAGRQKKKRIVKTRKETALALIDEIISEVDRRYLFLNVFYYCSFSKRYNTHMSLQSRYHILYHIITRVF